MRLRSFVHNDAAVSSLEQLERAAAAIRDAEETLKSFNKLAQDVNAQVEPVVTDYKETTAKLRGALERAENSIASVEETLNTTLDDVQGLVKHVDAEVEPLSAYNVRGR